MAGDHHSPAASGNPHLNQNDVTPAAHNQHSGKTLRRRNNRKIQTLINAVNFITFIPKLLILQKQESFLKRLGLHNFSKIKLDQSIRSDLIAQVIANYDPDKRCSSVNGERVRVSRADLARALELPVGKQDANENDLGVFSDEEIEFVDDFVFNWMLIHEESWVMPEKIVRMTRCVRDGHPEKLDAASLIWYKVERELGLGVKLVDCYYASHLQRLVRSQCELLFEVDEERISGVELTLAPDAELSLGHETVDELVDSKNNSGGQLLQRCQTSGLSNNEQMKVEEDGERIEKVSIFQDDDAELALGHATMDEQVDLHNNLGEQLLQRCQPDDLNNNEEVGDIVDEHIVQVEDDEVKEDEEHIEKVSDVQLSLAHDVDFTVGHEAVDELVDSKNNSGEQLLQHCQMSDLNNNEAKVEDVVDLEVEDGEGKEDEDDGERMEKVSTVQEDDVQLTLAHNVELPLEHENVDQLVNLKNNSGEQFLHLCQTSDLNDNNNNNNNEEAKVEDIVNEQIVEVEDDKVKDDVEHIEKVSIVQEDDVQLTLSNNIELTFGHETVDELMDSKNNSGEQFLQHSKTSDLNNEEVKVEDEQIVKVDDENDDAIDIVGSRDDSFINNNNNGKRVMESEDDTHSLDMNNKRLKTNDMWDHNQSEFGLCMVQMDQWIEKAKMITDSKQQSYVNHKYHQDSAMHELQDRQQFTEMIIKSKDEALKKKHDEVYRLKHELYLMGDLLSGYRKALNDEHIKFSEYRERVRAQEKPALKDVGLGDVSEEKGGGEEH
ncbi:uncharacterized protein LOC143562403 [Bidens hawaiensis]|uniref:uncharacterized protein LOC143562403 n=1 Tax=Bidens hawaiensis TaxID=980011 RepID=UPI00404AAC3C